MASSCPTIADATSRCTASATRWNSSGSSGVGSASAPAIAALSTGMLIALLTNDLTLVAGIEHAHGIAVVVGHEDAVRALVHRQGIGATLHGNGAYDPPAVSVEHAHATTAVVGDEDAPVTLVHGHRAEELARDDGAQDGPTRGVKHAHAATGAGDEGTSGCLVQREPAEAGIEGDKDACAHGDGAQDLAATRVEHAHGTVAVGDEDAPCALVHRQGIGAEAHGDGAQALPGSRVKHAHVVVSLIG